MPVPLEVPVPLVPRARFDVIDVRASLAAETREALAPYPRCMYFSSHTTAGYLDQSLVARLSRRRAGIAGYIAAFRMLFPEGASYRHDAIDERSELTDEERRTEPRNGDSHLAFIAAGLASLVTYRNDDSLPVAFVDLDGVRHDGHPRHRQTRVIGFRRETAIERMSIGIPVSAHPVDSVNLRDARLGLYDELQALIARHGVAKGRIRLQLAASERQAGLTVNEYETLLMQHDLRDVVRDPLRYLLERGRHALADPRAVPTKTLGYATYDLVRAFNEIVEALGLSESFIERLLSRAIAIPAARFFRVKRSVDLLVSDHDSPGSGHIVEGRYQSPILIQWQGAAGRMRRLEATLVQLA